MSDTRGMSRRVKDTLVQIIGAIEYDGEPAFVQVLDNTKDQFEGYPTVVLLPSQISSEDGDNRDKDHKVSFAALVYWQLNDKDAIEADLFNALYDVTDLLINTLETADLSGELSQLDDTIQAWMMNTTEARWFTGQSKAGSLLICRLNIDVSYSQFLG